MSWLRSAWEWALDFTEIRPRRKKPSAPAIIVAPGDCRLVNVGVNDYAESPENRLRGAVNDSSFVRRDETERGATTVAAMLLDYAATKRTALELLGNAAADLKAGQILIAQWSSHGDLIPDEAEDDGLMEALCPTDALLDYPKNMISARDLSNTFANVTEGARVLFLADCCHSGLDPDDAARLRAFVSNPHGYRRPRALIRPDGLSGRPAGARVRRLARGQVVTPWRRWILLSGCRSEQTSADAHLDGEYQGAMTHAYRAARRKRPALSLSELHDHMRRTLAAGGFDQDPQLEGTEEHLGLVLP